MATDPPGYFVGRPLQYQDKEQQPQTVPPAQPPPAAAAVVPAVDDPNAVNAQVPGYYKGRVQSRPSDGTEHHHHHHNNNNSNSNNANAAVQQNREPGFFSKLCGCFSGSSGNAN